MKILLVYFKQRMMCETAEQAVGFINSLHFHDNENCPKLVVNENTATLLDDLFQREWVTDGPGYPYIEVKKTEGIFFSCIKYYSGHDIRTTNCRNTSVKIYFPLGGTLEEHDAEFSRLEEQKKAASIQRMQEEHLKRDKELDEQKEGWYSVSLTYTRMKYPQMQVVETTFTGKCIASSGRDAYRKAIADLEKDGEASMGAVYPDVYSYNYSFLYLGVKIDGGYTFQPLNEEDF